MDNPTGTGTVLAFKLLFHNAYLRRRAPTQEQILATLGHQIFLKINTLSFRKLPLLSNRRVWGCYIEENEQEPSPERNRQPALPRAIVWSEPVKSAIGTHLAKRTMRLWHSYSRVGPVRSGLYKLYSKTGRARGPTSGILSHVTQPRDWCMVSPRGFIPCGHVGQLSHYGGWLP